MPLLAFSQYGMCLSTVALPFPIGPLSNLLQVDVARSMALEAQPYSSEWQVKTYKMRSALAGMCPGKPLNMGVSI